MKSIFFLPLIIWLFITPIHLHSQLHITGKFGDDIKVSFDLLGEGGHSRCINDTSSIYRTPYIYVLEEYQIHRPECKPCSTSVCQGTFEFVEQVNSKNSSQVFSDLEVGTFRVSGYLGRKQFCKNGLYEIVYDKHISDTILIHEYIADNQDKLYSKKQTDIGVFPNPFYNEFYVTIPEKENKNIELMIYDISGQLRISKTLRIGKSPVRVSAEELSTGVYYLIILEHNTPIFQKVIINNGSSVFEPSIESLKTSD